MRRSDGLALLLLLAACGRSPPHVRPASAAFHATWSDGRAELSSYRVRTMRYGEPRDGELVTVYVTEPFDRTRLVKDDDAEGDARLDVIKLHSMLRFQTGIYPYSVATSVFAPIDDLGGERFSPVKLTLTSQEWCGHVFHGVWPELRGFRSELRSYFASEGDTTTHVRTPAGTLYEDALPIQLRELDGPFAGGGDYHGHIVPSLWSARRDHRELAAVEASITRSRTELDGIAVTRFTLHAGDRVRTFDVEREGAHRVLRIAEGDGEEARLIRTTRLPYWQLNHVGDERHRAELGLPENAYPSL